MSAKERTPFRGKFLRDARHTVHLCKLIFRVYTAFPLPAPSPFPPSGPSSRYTPVAVSRHVAVSRDRNNHRERTPKRERSTAGDLLLLRVCHLLGCWDLRPFFLSLSPLSLSLSSLPSHPSERKTCGLGRCALCLSTADIALFFIFFLRPGANNSLNRSDVETPLSSPLFLPSNRSYFAGRKNLTSLD